MHAKYEVAIFYSEKVIAKFKVDNKQTGQSNMPPIIWSGPLKVNPLYLNSLIHVAPEKSNDKVFFFAIVV